LNEYKKYGEGVEPKKKKKKKKKKKNLKKKKKKKILRILILINWQLALARSQTPDLELWEIPSNTHKEAIAEG